MAHTDGKNIKIRIDDITISGVMNAQLNVSAGMLVSRSTAGSCGKWTEYAYDKIGWEIPVTCAYDAGALLAAGDIYDYIYNESECVVYFGDTTFVGTYWGGRALIRNLSISAPNDGLTTFQFTLIGVTPLYRDQQLIAIWQDIIDEPFTLWAGTTPDRPADMDWIVGYSAGYSGGGGDELTDDSGKCKFGGYYYDDFGYSYSAHAYLEYPITIGKRYRLSYEYHGDSGNVLGIGIKYSDGVEYDFVSASSQSLREFYANSERIRIYPVVDTDLVSHEDTFFATIDNFKLELYTGR